MIEWLFEAQTVWLSKTVTRLTLLPWMMRRPRRAARSATHQWRQVMGKRSMFVGMDVHKESIDISLAEEGRDGEVRHYGSIAGIWRPWRRW